MSFSSLSPFMCPCVVLANIRQTHFLTGTCTHTSQQGETDIFSVSPACICLTFDTHLTPSHSPMLRGNTQTGTQRQRSQSARILGMIVLHTFVMRSWLPLRSMSFAFRHKSPPWCRSDKPTKLPSPFVCCCRTPGLAHSMSSPRRIARLALTSLVLKGKSTSGLMAH